MRRILHILSGIICALLLLYLVGVGIYQAQQLIAFMPGGPEAHAGCKAVKVGGNICTIYPDRFGTIAMGSIFPLILSPFILVFLQTRKVSPSAKRTVLIHASVLFGIVVVHFSGLVIYRLYGLPL